MVSFLKRFRRVFGIIIGIGLFILLVQFFYQESRLPGLRNDLDASVLENYRKKLDQKPYDSELLLQSARHHYYVVRNLLNDQSQSADVPRTLIKRGLQNYRRLEALEEDVLSREDYFFNAYLYYQLGQNLGERGVGTPYVKRARDMALRSYERGYRSEELITLLGNLHFAFGEYDVALDYYRSLGEHGADPQVLFNRAWVHRTRGNFDQAEQLLRQAIDTLPGDGGARWQRFQIAYARLNIDREQYRDALDRIQEIPDYQNNMLARTLYARSLIGLGMEDEAREILEEINSGPDPPREARRLLEMLSSSTVEDRS